MERYYPTLFSPIKIGKKVIARNRIETAPTLYPGISPEGYPTDSFIAYYRNKARGGAGIVTVGETPVDWDYGKTHACQIQLRGEHAGMYLANVVDGIHRYGALANIELCHGGVFGAPELIGGKNPIGPSPCVRADGVQVQEITYGQMEQVAVNFAEAAAICKNCGFDMVMIHLAHGWLLGAWLSPIYNHRTDGHGGSFDNRCKYPLYVLEKVRQAVGPDFPIEIRISGSELVPEGSTIEDCCNFVKKRRA